MSEMNNMEQNTLDEAAMEAPVDGGTAETAVAGNPIVGFAAGFAAGVGITKVGDKIATKVKAKQAEHQAKKDEKAERPKTKLVIRKPWAKVEVPSKESKPEGSEDKGKSE